MVYNLRDRKNQPSYYDDGDAEEADADAEAETEAEGEADEDYIPRLGTSAPSSIWMPSSKRGRERDTSPPHKFFKKYNKEEKAYLRNLPYTERNQLLKAEEAIGNAISKDLVPLRFRVLSSQMDTGVKRLILQKLEQFTQMGTDNGEYYKLKHWLENVSQLPFQRYCNLPVSKEDPPEKVAEFMNHTKKVLDDTVFGHEEPKQQILRIIAQWVSNPSSHGHCIGIHGPMGIGKTSLIKEGLAKALGIPFGFIALGGATDGSFLEGHSYTYEGATYGKIAEILIRTQCSNPIIFFDELDKVSATKKGEEITGILTHLTDTSQNERYADKYFGEVELDLSRCLIVFSYNDENLINPILKDRLITIEVSGYSKEEKVKIATDYLLPTIFKSFGFQPTEIHFSKEMIETVIQHVPEEEGVRNLKRGLECVVSWINMYKYIPNNKAPISFPYTVSSQFITEHLRKKDSLHNHLHHHLYL